MLKPIFAYKMVHYYRLLMVHCIVQPHFLDTGLTPGFSDGGGHRSLLPKGRQTSRYTRGRLGRTLLNDYTAVGVTPIVVLLGLGTQVGTSYALVIARRCIRLVVVLLAMLPISVQRLL